MNYVHYSLQFLFSILQNTILWLFNTELVNYENISISFGSAFIYFFIVYLVISLLLNAKYSNLGQIKKEQVRNARKDYD